MSRIIDWLWSPVIKDKPIPACEDCYYYRMEERNPQYFQLCGKCLENKKKQFFRAKFKQVTK